MRDLKPQPCFRLPRGAGLRLALKTRLSEVLVERKRGLELHAPHHGKRNAVGKGQPLVVVLGERLIEHVGSDNERLRALLKQPSERDRWLVMLIVCVFQRQYETGVEQDGR